MTIQKANTGHIPGLIRLLYQVGGVHHDIRPDIFCPGAIKYTEQDLADLLRDENRPVFVAVEEETVLGYCFCVIEDCRGTTVLTDRVEIYIDDLCVEEKCRGRGIAKALYTHVCAWAKDAGCAYVTLNVWCGNDGAMKFYEKMGMT
ncbi:MAG: GNAT family N-acetyltransferase, partial [Oscillospiraceae bacterium]|nr:GNAT family N-acetyltransferase [Oscillospiraceae bacterium]